MVASMTPKAYMHARHRRMHGVHECMTAVARSSDRTARDDGVPAATQDCAIGVRSTTSMWTAFKYLVMLSCTHVLLAAFKILACWLNLPIHGSAFQIWWRSERVTNRWPHATDRGMPVCRPGWTVRGAAPAGSVGPGPIPIFLSFSSTPFLFCFFQL
jgi:hypothetical protein